MNNLVAGYSQGWRTQPISDAVPEGAFLFLCGPNGSGKSTFLKTLAGILSPQAGEVIWSQGHTPVFLPNEIRVQPGVRVCDLQDIFSRRSSPASKFKSYLERLDVNSNWNKSLSELSSGARQRVLLAATLSHDATFVFLDEPFSFLEWHAIKSLTTLLCEEHRNGRSFIISNHDLNWTLQIPSAQVWVLNQGQRMIAGPVQEVLVSSIFQETFKFRTQIADNPLDQTPMLAVAPYEKT